MGRLKRIEDKIDKMADHMAAVDITLAEQAVVLKDHVLRTNLLQKKIEPIDKNMEMLKNIAKIISFIGVGIIMKLLHEMVMK